MFEGMTFCVLVTPQETKNLIVESIVKHGGREVRLGLISVEELSVRELL